MKFTCAVCGNTKIFIKASGPHIGIYCNKCGKFIKWASKNEKNYLYGKGFLK